MNNKLSIQPATMPHAAMLASLHAESFGVEGWSCDQIRGSLALTTTRGWIAYDGDKPAGFILCQALPGEWEILTFCVASTQRKQGIGAALLRFVLKNAQAEPGKIFLEVAADNAAARHLYEKFGFSVTGTRANYYKRGAVTVDAVRYEK